MNEPGMVEQVLRFWFGEPAVDTATLGQKMRRWFQGGTALDDEIRGPFSEVVASAIAGELVEWERELDARLALVLVLDQFPRSIYRGDPRAFAGDPRAQRLAIDSFDRGLDRALTLERRQFLCMPLLHAEDLALQDRGIVESDRLFAEATDWQRPIYAMGVEQARKYRDIIARFGRFPHRNAVLGRISTPEEEAFLVGWNERQPPRGANQL